MSFGNRPPSVRADGRRPGDLRPVIDSRYPLEQIADAHRAMERNANVGKILIDVVRARRP